MYLDLILFARAAALASQDHKRDNKRDNSD